MKKFIIWSSTFFLIAGAVTIGLFFFVGSYGATSISIPPSVDEVTSTAVIKADEKTSEATEAVADLVPEGGIPLSTLPLSESHKKALSAAKIDVDTFVLTEGMIVCAGGKIGSERIAEIIEGSAPSVLEMAKLIPCLGS